MLGTKAKYIPTIKKLRVALINSMFTSDLVQMERNVEIERCQFIDDTNNYEEEKSKKPRPIHHTFSSFIRAIITIF